MQRCVSSGGYSTPRVTNQLDLIGALRDEVAQDQVVRDHSTRTLRKLSTPLEGAGNTELVRTAAVCESWTRWAEPLGSRWRCIGSHNSSRLWRDIVTIGDCMLPSRAATAECICDHQECVYRVKIPHRPRWHHREQPTDNKATHQFETCSRAAFLAKWAVARRNISTAGTSMLSR